MSTSTNTPRLGQYLPCSTDSISVALRQQSQGVTSHPHRRLGEVLLEGRFITPEDLRAGIAAQRVDRLRRCTLFDGLSAPDLRALSEVFDEHTIAEGATFIRQGAADAYLYVLASGALEVFLDGEDGVGTALAVVAPGEPVGEMGFLLREPRTASVRAREQCELLRTSYAELGRMLERMPRLARAFLDVLSRRLTRVNALYGQGHARLRRVEHTLHDMNAVLDLGEAAELGEGIEGLIRRLVGAASTLTCADRASLFLIDPATGELWSKVAEGAGTREIRVPAGSGIIGWVAANGAAVRIPDAYADERFNPEVDRRTGYRTRSVLSAPIHALDGEVIGVVQVVNKRSGRFDEHDENLIRAFAHQAAIAVENFNLYRRVMLGHRRMALLLDVARHLGGALDFDTLIAKVVSLTSEALHCERSSFFVVDEARAELWSMETEGARVAEIRFPVSAGLAGAAARSAAAVRVADAYEDVRFNRDFDARTGFQTRSVLCVPVVDREQRVTGVIECMNRRDGAFDEADEQLLGAIAAQISVALDNARLHARAVGMRNYLDRVQQCISSGIVTLDGDHRVVTVNQAALGLLGRLAPGDDVRGAIGERLCEMLVEVYERGAPVSEYDMVLSGPGRQSATVNSNVLPLHDAEGALSGLVLLIEDITSEKRVKSAFSHYLAPAVIEQVLADPERLALGGEKREVTALFTDIEGFTALSEAIDPGVLVQLLGAYFDEVCPVVLRYGGTIDKIVGDSLHVLFNAPVDQPDHARQAVLCALELDRVCRRLTARTFDGGRIGRTRIGINTGESVVGNFGGAERFDYTAHGDAINTASRLESVNRFLGTCICVSASTAMRCAAIVFRPVGHLVLKGKSEPVEVFEPVSDPDASSCPVGVYLEAYREMERRARGAVATFAELHARYPGDGLVAFHARRMQAGEEGDMVVLDQK